MKKNMYLLMLIVMCNMTIMTSCSDDDKISDVKEVVSQHKWMVIKDVKEYKWYIPQYNYVDGYPKNKRDTTYLYVDFVNSKDKQYEETDSSCMYKDEINNVSLRYQKCIYYIIKQLY